MATSTRCESPCFRSNSSAACWHSGAGMALGREGPTVHGGHGWLSVFTAVQAPCWRRPGAVGRRRRARALLPHSMRRSRARSSCSRSSCGASSCASLLRRLRHAVPPWPSCVSLIGDHLVFSVPTIEVELFPGYLMFLALGGVMGALGAAYNRMIVAGLDLVDRLRRVPPGVPAAIVGGVVGLLAWLWPNLIGGGESQVQGVLDGGYSVGALGFVFAFRLAARAALLCAGTSRRFVRTTAGRRRRGRLVVRYGSQTLIPAVTTLCRRLPRSAWARFRWSRACADNRHRPGGGNDGRDQPFRAAPDRMRECYRGSLHAGQPAHLRYFAGPRYSTAEGIRDGMIRVRVRSTHEISEPQPARDRPKGLASSSTSRPPRSATRMYDQYKAQRPPPPEELARSSR